MAAESAEAARTRLRWAVNVSAWQLLGGVRGDEWRFLAALLPPDAAARCAKFVYEEDQKRALASQLLQRAACAHALSMPFERVVLSRTKGGKPFLADPAERTVHAPNWNFNVSHEGDYVVLAAEPLCVCGVDVAAPGQLRRRGTPQMLPMREHLQQFKRQFTAAEVAHILSAGSEGAQQSAFQRIWSLKEAMVKARGDGLAYDLGRAEFTVHDGGTASLLLDSAPQRHWAFNVEQLGPATAKGTHWVTVARCRPQDVVDAVGSFRATLLARVFEEDTWRALLQSPSPPFEMLTIADTLPAPLRDAYAALGGDII